MKKLIMLVFLSLIRLSTTTRIWQLDMTTELDTIYSEFLESIRQELSDPDLHYGGTDLLVMEAPSDKFLRVDLLLSSGMVSLGVLRNDLYILSYMAKNEAGENWVYYIGDETVSRQPQLEEIFPEVSSSHFHEMEEYDEQYQSIQRVARKTRKDIGLGFHKLASHAEKLHMKRRNVQNEACFILLAVQMVAESARFKFIEDLVISNFPHGFSANQRVYMLESNWGSISQEVKDSCNGVFKKTITLTCFDFPGEIWKVNNIAGLNIGILKRCEDDEEEESVESKVRDVRNREIAQKGLQKTSKKDCAARRDGTCHARLPHIVRKNGRNGGRSRSFSSALKVQKPVSLDSMESTSREVLLVVSLVGVLISLLRNLSNPRIRRGMKSLLSRMKVYK